MDNNEINDISKIGKDMLPFGDSIIPLAQLAGIGFWRWDVNQNKTWCTQQLEIMLGYEAGEVSNGYMLHSSELIHEIVHKEDILHREKLIKELISGKQSSIVNEFRAVKKDGTQIWLKESCTVTSRNLDGTAATIAAAVNDITSLKAAEEHHQLKVALEEKETYLQNAVRTSTAMFEANPYSNLIFNDDYKLIDCNPAAISFFGFSDKSSLISNFDNLFRISRPKLISEGNPTIYLGEQLKLAKQHGIISFDVTLLLRRRQIILHIILKRISYEDSFAIAMYAVDMTNTHKITKELEDQKNLLSCINGVAMELLSADPENYKVTIQESMECICQAADVDRMCIWKNKTQNGKLYSSQLYEWHRESINAGLNDGWIELDRHPMWRDAISRGKTINASSGTLGLRSLFGETDIKSMLIIPIILDRKVWGIISFDNFHSKRVFTENEVNTLRSGCFILVSGLLRNTASKRMLETQRQLEDQSNLLMAVNMVAECLMSDIDVNKMDTMVRALEILSISVNVERAYVWSNYLEDGMLYCNCKVEWAKDGCDYTQSDVTTIMDYDSYFPDWKKQFKQSFYIRPEEMSPKLVEFRGVRANTPMLIMPIILDGAFWGFVGFDDEEGNRTFTSEEIHIIRSGGLLISSAIVRNEVTQNLIEAREEALATTKSKSEFLARMSHEIRTPMNAIIGMTAIAHKAHDMERVNYCLNKIEASSRQLLSIINDVLDMSKIDADKFEILSEEFDFEKMLENVFNVIQVKMAEKDQEFFFDFDQAFTHKVISDELRLNQVLINLLSNAIKFTPDCGNITLSVRIMPIDDDRATLRTSVSDTGIGIEESKIDGLFESFEQADGGITRQYGGTGLGLAICKKIINLMGGRIWVESTLGKGSVFIFEIDVMWGEELGIKRTKKTLNEDLNILVVDDIPDVLEYFQNILESFNLKCQVSESGYDAIEKVKKATDDNNPFDLIFLDWKMPGLNGLETARQIRAFTKNQVIVIIVSALDWDEIESEAKQISLNHFLPKPVLPSSLYNMLLDVTVSSNEVYVEYQGHDTYNWGDKCIIIAEDIEINREIVISLLEDTHIQIDIACDGEECVEKFTANPNKYDLILMDIQMPRLDGLGATRKIRDLDFPKAKEIPIIAMTANAFKEDEQACIAAGMNGHLSKPLDINIFFPALQKYFQN